MLNSEAYRKFIDTAKARIPSGASFTGDLSEHVRKLYSMVNSDLSSGVITMLPGDYVRIGSDESAGVSLAAPIGYDVWYLFQTVSILPFETGEDTARTEEILERLDAFLSKLQDIKPLKSVRNREDLSFHKWWSWPDAMNYWENNAPYVIKEMRYETILKGQGFKYPSKMPDGSVGFLAFPVGQLGVMEIVSLIGESITESESFSLDGREFILPDGGMMAPVKIDNRGFCAGEHLSEQGYLLQGKTEYPADDFAGQDSVTPHGWLRHWLMSEDTFPVPGEFVVLLAKPESYHVSWFQDTFPFMYSGNFWETEYYSSGIVQEVIEPDDDSDEVTNIYKVWIRCYEMYMRPTDFYLYKVGDRVAVLKGNLELVDNMDWTLLGSSKNNDSSSEIKPDEDWKIAPISFYQ